MWPIERGRPEASRVVIAACPLGLGTHALFPVDRPFWSRIARRLTHFRLADLDRPLEKLRTVFKLIRQKQHHLMVLSPGLKRDELTGLFPHSQWFGEWETLRAALEARHGKKPVTVVVYRCAPLLLPAAAERNQEVGAQAQTLTTHPSSA